MKEKLLQAKAKGHWLIIGCTGSGKSSLARFLVRNSGEMQSVVYDPMKTQWEGATFITDDFQMCYEISKLNENLAIVIDEAGIAHQQFKDEMIELAVQSRHRNNCIIFIAQRATMLLPSIRHNCHYIAAFTTAACDADAIARDFILSSEAADALTALPKFNFLFASRFGGCVQGELR